MSKTIVAIFNTRDYAERASREIKQEGLKIDNISIIARSEEEARDNDNISDGLFSGAAIGGVAGLALGFGSVMIPGLGIIAAAGPIAGLISGAAAGGIVGTLVDLGIPEADSRKYEDEIRSGKVYFSMPITDETGGAVSKILKDNGADSVEIHK